MNHRLRSLIPHALYLLPLALLASCSQEEAAPVPAPVEEQGFNLTLSIPEISFGSSYASTRAGKDEIKDNEGNLNSLYFVIFKKDEESPGDVYKAIYCNDLFNGSYRDPEGTFSVAPVLTGKLTDEYQDRELNINNKCDLKLGEGKYKFYLLGNVYEYWDSGDVEKSKNVFLDAIETEEDIRNLSLKFDGLLVGDNLPMICFPEKVCSDTNGTLIPLDGGVFTVSYEDATNNIKKKLYAPLSILCSKVRYTILFDNIDEKFSWAFKDKDVHFTESEEVDGQMKHKITQIDAVKISNLSSSTLVSPANSTQTLDLDIEDEENLEEAPEEGGIFPASLSQVVYPDKTDEKTKYYLDIRGATNSPEYLDLLEERDTWNNPGKRAWQGGAIYIPENLVESKETTLHFFATGIELENTVDYTIRLNPKRGTFYDIVAKVTSPSAFDIAVLIKVNPWSYNSGQVTW